MKLAIIAVLGSAAVYLGLRKRKPLVQTMAEWKREAFRLAPADTEARLRHALGAGRAR